MHVFQPYPMDMLEWNPMEKISKEWFMLVTESEGKANLMTCSWGGIGHIWNKNSVSVYVRESRYTHEMLDKSDTFAVCFLDPNEKSSKSTLKYLGMVSGRDEDKVAGAKLTINHINDIAFVDESQFTILCRKVAAVPMPEDSILDDSIVEAHYKNGDYHTMYIGEIIEILAR